MKFSTLLLTASVLALGVSTQAFAQNSEDTVDPTTDEIIVTSTRRAESVLDIPYNISALSGDDLLEQGIKTLSDLRNSVPGLSAPDYGGRGNSVNNGFVIRGINTDAVGGPTSFSPNLQTPGVSVYVDEIPLFANLQLTDVARVEVLRGPQGTLFGSGSVGGTIRIISNRPEFEALSWTANGEVSQTRDSGNMNYSLDGAVNIPLSDSVAMRFSAGLNEQAGFVDALGAVQIDANGLPVLANPSDQLNSGFILSPRVEDYDDYNSWFLRGALRFQPSDKVDVELTYQHQEDESGGFSFQTPGLERENLRRFPGEFSETQVDAAGLTATVDFGFATLTSASSYSDVDTDSAVDYTGIFALFDQVFFAYGGFPRLIGVGDDRFGTETLSQEFRLVSNGNKKWDYVVGAFYQKVKTDYIDEEFLPGFTDWAVLPGSAAAIVNALPFLQYYGLTPNSSFSDVQFNYYPGIRAENYPVRDLVYDYDRDTEFEEIAVFGELSYEPSDKLELTVGARVFQQDFSQDLDSNAYSLGTATGGVVAAKFDDAIFKANISYDLTNDLMGYATFSQGFRTGGANPIVPCATPTSRRCDDPLLASYNPDTSDNYELGLKGRLFDGNLSFTAAIFQLNWDDIQLQAGSFDGSTIVVNGETARSQGLEFEGRVSLSENVSVNAGYAYNDAELTADAIIGAGNAGGPIVSLLDGSKLPGVSPHQFNLGTEIVGKAFGNRDTFFNLNMTHRSSFNTRIDPTDLNFSDLDSLTLVNGSAGLQIMDNVQLSIFATNIFDEIGINGVALGPVPVQSFNAVQFLQRPRTVGFRLRIEG